MISRKKKTLVNIIFSIALEGFTVVSGFIIPRLIISIFGSEVNGMVNSIADFIGYIALLQTGVGSAIKAALYKPLAQNDHKTLCTIVKTTERFFTKIAIASLVYIAVLSIIYPLFIARNFEYVFTAVLVIVIGLGTAAQYFFGITYQMVLEADQRDYVYSIIQIITITLNTIAVVVAVKLGASIIIVKLCSAVFFIIRPIVLRIYAKKHYNIVSDGAVDYSYIKERWNAFGQGMAYFIHSKTDVFVLTLLSSFQNISIYSVYALVTRGLTTLTSSVEKAVRAALGNIIAKEEDKHLKVTFEQYQTFMHVFSTICFATASITIFEFIDVYVGNIADVDYYQPSFGIIIIAAECLYCLRLPYYSVIYAAGKFKETKTSAYIEAGLNIIISVALVYKFGLVGVAVGTFVAMAYRTIAFVVFLHSQVLKISYVSQLRRYIITIFAYVSSILLFGKISMFVNSYATWILYALIIFFSVSIYVLLVNFLLDKSRTTAMISSLLGTVKRKI